MVQTVKNLPKMQETRFDPWVGKIHQRREWLPTPVFLPGEFHGQRSLMAYSGVAKELDMTEWLSLFLTFLFYFSLSYFLALLRYNWYIILSLRCTVCWIDALRYHTTISTMVLAKTSITSHNYHFFLVMRTFKISFLSNIQGYNTLSFTVISMLSIWSPEFIHLITGSL